MADPLAAFPPGFSHAYRDALLVSAYVELLMDGIYTAVVLFTFTTVISRKTLKGSNLPLLGVIFLLYAMAIIHLGNHTSYIRNAFINHADTSEDTILFLFTPDNLSILSDVMLIGMAFFADCILTWRVYVVWGRNWLAMILPTLLTLAGLSFGITLIVFAHEPPQLVNNNFASKVGTAYYSLLLCTTVVCTLLIAGRIFYLGGKPGLSKYWHVVEVVVESAALYAIVLIIYLPYIIITDLIASMPVYIIQGVVIPITGIAPTLIVARVALGVNPKENTWIPPPHSGGDLRFGSTSGTAQERTTTMFSGQDSVPMGSMDKSEYV